MLPHRRTDHMCTGLVLWSAGSLSFLTWNMGMATPMYISQRTVEEAWSCSLRLEHLCGLGFWESSLSISFPGSSRGTPIPNPCEVHRTASEMGCPPEVHRRGQPQWAARSTGTYEALCDRSGLCHRLVFPRWPCRPSKSQRTPDGHQPLSTHMGVPSGPP